MTRGEFRGRGAIRVPNLWSRPGAENPSIFHIEVHMHAHTHHMAVAMSGLGDAYYVDARSFGVAFKRLSAAVPIEGPSSNVLIN